MLISREEDNSFLSTCIKFLPKLTNYLVGLGLLCFLLGFVVSNLYLGSLGIVNLDMLRARYVLVGALFLAFLGAIFYLMYGLRQVFQRNRWEEPWTIIGRLISYSLRTVMLLYVVVLAGSVLAGSVTSPPVGTPGLSMTPSWSDWLSTEPRRILTTSTMFFGAVLLVVAVLCAVIIVINPKDRYGSREPRRVLIRRMVGDLRNNWLTLLVGLFVIALVMWTVMSLSSFFVVERADGILGGYSPLLSGWFRFLLGIVTIYLAFGTVLVMILMPHRRSVSKDKDDVQEDPMSGSPAVLWAAAMAVSLILPIYALGIYPALLQQIGGGQVLRVEVAVSSDALKPTLEADQNELYMVDRAPGTTMFLIVNNDTQETSVMEVSNSLIESITYNPSR